MNIAELGLEFRKYRKEKGVTLLQVANDLGMSINTLSRFENCKPDSNIGLLKFMRMAEYVGLSIETRHSGFEFSYTLEDAERENANDPYLKM